MYKTVNTFITFQSDENFQFPSGMKIVGDKVWAVSCQLQNHLAATAPNRKSIKYRVLVGRVEELLKGTGCDKRSASVGSPYSSAVQKLDPSKDRLIFSG